MREEIEEFEVRLLAGTWTRRDVVRLIEISQRLQVEAKAWANSCDRFAERNRSLEKALTEIVYLPDETQAYSYADACVQIARAALDVEVA